MSIFTFEEKHEKELKRERTEYERQLNRAIKKAEIEDKKMEDFFRSEGAEIYLTHLKNERDICLRAMEMRVNDDRLQERYAIRCADIKMIEMYVNRVKST